MTNAYRWWVASLLAVAGCAAESGGGGVGDDRSPIERCAQTVADKIADAEAAGVSIADWPVHDSPTMDPANAGGADIASSAHNPYYRDDLASHPGCTTVDLYYDKQNDLSFDPEAGTFGYDAAQNGNNDFFWQDASTNPVFGTTNVVSTAMIPDGDVARIPGYPCAAKAYVTPGEDKGKPVVILVHGNSTRPHNWEEFQYDPDELDANGQVATPTGLSFTPAEPYEQLASRLIAQGYRVIAFDARTDRIATFEAERNPARNMSHGWAVPMLQALIEAVIAQNLADAERTEKRIALVGHSFGGSAIRDALRRQWLKSLEEASVANPFAYTSHVVTASTPHHGVLTYDQGGGGEPPGYCDTERPTMRGWVTCEYGSLISYTPTYFTEPLNGYKDLFSTPCADGDFAYGRYDACAGNVVSYTNVYMEDPATGEVGLDGFLNANSMTLDMDGCVDNRGVTTMDFDWSGYFFRGMLAAHMGTIRSRAGLDIVMEELAE